jgi:hypothetical protein
MVKALYGTPSVLTKSRSVGNTGSLWHRKVQTQQHWPSRSMGEAVDNY